MQREKAPPFRAIISNFEAYAEASALGMQHRPRFFAVFFLLSLRASNLVIHHSNDKCLFCMFIRLTSRKSSIYHHYWSCHFQTIKLESSCSRFANESHNLWRAYCDKQKLINDSFEKEFIVQSSMECKCKIPICWSVTKNRAEFEPSFAQQLLIWRK